MHWTHRRHTWCHTQALSRPQPSAHPSSPHSPIHTAQQTLTHMLTLAPSRSLAYAQSIPVHTPTWVQPKKLFQPYPTPLRMMPRWIWRLIFPPARLHATDPLTCQVHVSKRWNTQLGMQLAIHAHQRPTDLPGAHASTCGSTQADMQFTTHAHQQSADLPDARAYEHGHTQAGMQFATRARQQSADLPDAHAYEHGHTQSGMQFATRARQQSADLPGTHSHQTLAHLSRHQACCSCVPRAWGRMHVCVPRAWGRMHVCVPRAWGRMHVWVPCDATRPLLQQRTQQAAPADAGSLGS